MTLEVSQAARLLRIIAATPLEKHPTWNNYPLQIKQTYSDPNGLKRSCLSTLYIPAPEATSPVQMLTRSSFLDLKTTNVFLSYQIFSPKGGTLLFRRDFRLPEMTKANSSKNTVSGEEYTLNLTDLINNIIPTRKVTLV